MDDPIHVWQGATVGTNFGIDLAAGQQLVRQESFGDWYKDPWGWPELTRQDLTELDCEEHGVLARDRDKRLTLVQKPQFQAIAVPKSRLGVRPAVLQDPLSRLVFLSAAAKAMPTLHAHLRPWVFGWRERDGKLSTSSAEWESYVASWPDPDASGYSLKTDLTSFFASVRPVRLATELRSRLGPTAVTDILDQVVETHDEMATRSGLPQRSFASAILAHAFVAPLDDEISAALERGGVVAARRWMDDISAEGDEDALYGLLMRLQERARQLGLELNAAKTDLLPCSKGIPHLWLDTIREITVPTRPVAADYGGTVEFWPDLDLLEAEEARILSDPRDARPQTVIAVLNTLTRFSAFDRSPEWLDNAHHLPSCAPKLAAYLRGATNFDSPLTAAKLADWFAAYNSSRWKSDGVGAAIALSFGADLPGKAVEVLREWLLRSQHPQQLATAAQKLAVADHVFARTTIMSRLDAAHDPLTQRTLALALMTAGSGQADTEQVLRRDPRNLLLLRWLDQTDWRVPDPAHEFVGSEPPEDGLPA